MTIAVGSDSMQHIGREVIRHLAGRGTQVIACGALAGRTADYIDSALEVAEKVARGECEFGVLLCNTGTGASIIANKVPGARAALCTDAYSARIARLANSANILVLSMRLTGDMLAAEILDEWLSTSPSTEPRRVAFHHKTEEVEARYRKERP
jgi:ribose 5-phosphate isomerase B